MLHLIKLCVGVDSVAELTQWQEKRALQRRQKGKDERPRHSTRNVPRRCDEIIAGGSLYWVIRHRIVVRQRVEEVLVGEDDEGRRQATLIFNPKLVLVRPRRKRPFQGWRYLTAEDAPPDLLSMSSGLADLPVELREELDAVGVH